MKTFVRCEMCNTEIPTDRCVFAICKKAIDGKEYLLCCRIMQRKKIGRGSEKPGRKSATSR